MTWQVLIKAYFVVSLVLFVPAIAFLGWAWDHYTEQSRE